LANSNLYSVSKHAPTLYNILIFTNKLYERLTSAHAVDAVY